LDLDGSYSELQYKDFLSNYRNAYREVYAMFDGVKAENEVLKRQLVKKDQEILSHQEANKQLAKDVMSLRKKINTKLSFSERLFGKIKF
jgi:hypothetical protein